MQTAEINSIEATLRELAPLVTDVQRTLEAGLDDDGPGADAVAAVVQPLATIRGTLELIELHAAAALVREMGELATGVASWQIGEAERALETLLEGVLRLPDYLDRVRAGHRDTPSVLLPLINALRGLREESALEESALFFPPLPTFAPAGGGDERLKFAAQRTRGRYQRALLGWYRGTADAGHLAELGAVLQELADASADPGAQQLWEVAGAFIDTLAETSADPEGRIKPLMARLERLISALARDGGAAFDREAPGELLRGLLYQIARSPSERASVRAVRQAYQLDQYMSDSEAGADFEGPNRELLGAVGEGIRADLAQVKDAVEIYVHSDERRPDVLDGLPERLKQIAETFSMLGLADDHAALKAESEALSELDALTPEGADQRLQALADELLRVESHLAQLQSGRTPSAPDAKAEQGPLGVRALPDSEYGPLVSAVVTAALENLSKVREAIAVYCSEPEAGSGADSGADREALGEIPGLLAEVEGAARMLPLERAAPLLRDLREYVQSALMAAGARLDDDDQMLIADVVAGLEYYLEAVAHDRAAMTHLLEGAVRAMDALRSGTRPIYDEDEEVVIEAPSAVPDGEQAGGDWVSADELADAAPGVGEGLNEVTDPGELEVIDLDDPFTLEDLEFGIGADATAESDRSTPAADAGDGIDWEEPTRSGMLEPSVESDIEQVELDGEPRGEAQGPDIPAGARADRAPAFEQAANEPAEAAAAGNPPSTAVAGEMDAAVSGSRYAIVGDEVDDDVVEVYIEEALGELDKINEQLPRWKANTADDDAVIVIRRAYHTLKGGGRLIGADLLGEFSWAMENLLNRVIDRSVAPGPVIFETLDEASAALPQLVEQIQGNRAPIDGIDDLIARAHALARGDAPPPISGGLASAEEMAAGSGAVPAPETPASGEARIEAAAEPDAWPITDEPDTPVAQDSIAAAAPEASTEPGVSPAGVIAASEPLAPVAVETGSGPDRTLLEIFAREAQTHQRVLHAALGAPDDPASDLPVSQEVDRAVHTLVGSAQTAGVEAIAGLAGEMEDIVRARREHGQALLADEVALFREAVAGIDRILDDLPAIGRTDVGDILARLQARREQVLDALQAGGGEGDSELLEVFLAEGDELLEQCDRAVAAWRGQPEARGPISELQRGLHTLKGGARMANLLPIGDLTHELEAVINAFDAAGTPPADAALELMQETIDALTILLEQARARQPIARVEWLVADLRLLLDEAENGPPAGATPPASESAMVQDALTGEMPADGGVAPAPADIAGEGEQSAPAAHPASRARSETEPAATGAPPDAPDAASAGEMGAGAGAAGPVASPPGSEQVRVQADMLDNLVNFAGEVSIYHSRLNEQFGQYRFNLTEFEQTVSRLRAQLRTMEDETESQILYRNQIRADEGGMADPQTDFDPLEFDRYTRLQELSRSLSESIGDLDQLKEIMDTLTRDAETLLLQQSRVSSELQDGLMQTRMVRFGGLRGRLARIVRQTAAQLGRKADLRVTGGELELDRSVQERIVAPLEHALRNAVAHGIESPEERQRLGKPAQGTVQLDLHRGGTDIIIEITDDGRGIDPAAVRRRAVDRGLIAADDARGDGEIIKLILESGFSTADAVTQIAGRGVGMDVVDAEVRRLGGTLGINTEVGVGTRFTIRLPVTLAINQAVLVETGDDRYAIPIASVEGVAQVTAADLKPYYIDPAQPFVYAGNEYRVQHLGRLLGTSEPRLDAPEISYPVIMIRAGDDRVALHVEQLVGRRDIVVKPLGAPMNELSGISGATILPDGRVVLILDVGGLLRTESRFVATGAGQPGEAPPVEAEPDVAAGATRTVLVVDDSITIRKVTQRILERHNFHVVTAKDGIDALAWMAQSVPDLILLDIEMPRMDGYEVATYVRGEHRLARVPIIMITSRTGEKHRGRAEDIGVDRYLGKPYQETELMEHIEQLIQAPATA